MHTIQIKQRETFMWVFAIWLYFAFLFGGNQYQELKDQGAACYVWVNFPGDPIPTEIPEQPTCFYDPTNLNPGK